MYIETIYKIWCPNKDCNKPFYVSNGNVEDLTVPDIEGVTCPWCGHQDTLSDEMTDLYGDEYEPYYTTGKKTLCDCTETTKKPVKKRKRD